MLYFRRPGHHNSTTLHVPKACLLLRLPSSNKERQNSEAELPHRYFSELPSTASSFPFADKERTFLQLVPYHTTSCCRLPRENPVDKPLQKTKLHIKVFHSPSDAKSSSNGLSAQLLKNACYEKKAVVPRNHCSPTAWLCP